MISKSKSKLIPFVLITGVMLSLPLFVHAQTPIDCGATLSGSITGAGQKISYSFTASANDGVTIRTRKTSGSLTAYMDLYNPGGTLLQSGSQIDRTLTDTGTYRIDVRDSGNTNTGNYVLFWNRMNNPCSATSTSCGTAVTGSIGAGTSPGPWQVYTFTASANDAISIRSVRTSTGSLLPVMELYGPTGTFITSAYNYPLDRVLTTAGTYTVLMRDYYNQYSGDFLLVWQLMSNPCNATAVNCGQVLSGSLSSTGQMNVYTFSASANDKFTIRVRKTSGTFGTYIELYGPNGSKISEISGGQIDQTITATGTHKIIVRDSAYVNSGNYLLYLEKLSGPCNVAASLTCGQVVTGTIGTSVDPPPWKIYTFTAAANDTVSLRTFKTSTGSFISYMELYGPTGTYLGYTYNSPLNLTLTTAGTYTILIRDYYNAYSGDFFLTFQKTKNACNPTSITSGQVLTGSIGSLAQMNAYTFSVSANDGITIRARKTSGTMTLIYEIYGPAGTSVGSSGGTLNIQPTSAGTYTVFVRDSSYTNTGNYLLYWNGMNSPSGAMTISCGQVVTASIGTSTDPPPWKIYTFTAAANDAMSLRSVKTSTGTFIPYMELYGPTGAYITYAYNYPLDRILTTAGTYTILVRDYYDSNAGDFLMTLQMMNNPCNASAINCGQVIGGSVTGIGQMNIYTFSASVNDGVTIRIRKTSGSLAPNIELYGPTGASVVGATASQIDRVLTTAGTYKIIVRDSSYVNTGDYLLYFQRMNNTPCNATPISCDQTVAGSIGTGVDPAPWKVYTFTATANDAVSIRSLKTGGASFISYMEVYNPSGTYVGGYYNYPLDLVLTATGTYTILMRDYYNAYSGDFLLTWHRYTNPCSASISPGQTATGSIGNTTQSPFWGFHSFTVSANDIVNVRAIKTSGTLVPYLELYRSNGTSMGSGAGQLNVTLVTAGAYTLVVRDQNNANAGGYAVTWQRWNNPGAEALACSQVAANSIGMTFDPPPWRYYSLTASANDSVTIRVTKTTGTFTPYLELYGPTGTQLGTGTGQLDRTVTATGTHTIVVRDQNNVNTGSYLLTWLRISNPCNAVPIGCGQVLSGSLSATGKVDSYTFTGTAGDNTVLTLTKTSGALNPSLELYNSSGTRLAYQYTPSGNQVTITQSLATTGTYTVFASDYGNDGTGSYTLKLQKNNNICPEVTVTSPNGGERIAARSSFTIRWTPTSSQGISSQEIMLSTDGGQTYPNVIASGLGGTVQSYVWNVPSDLVTNNARIRVTVTDTSGRSTPDESDADFVVFQSSGRTYVYDELTRLIQVIYEDERRVTYTYDAAGNRITLTHE